MSIPVLSGVLDGAEWWQRNVAEGLLGNAIGDKGVRDALRLGITRYLLPDEEKFANVRPGMSPSQVVDTAYADDPWRRFAATTLTDPLTYVGMGIPGRIAGALPAASKAATALRALN